MSRSEFGRPRLSQSCTELWSVALWHFGGPIGFGARRNAIGRTGSGKGTLRDRFGIRSCDGTSSVRVRIPTLTRNTIGRLGFYIGRRWLLSLLRKPTPLTTNAAASEVLPNISVLL
jgi:hypothetical protein